MHQNKQENKKKQIFSAIVYEWECRCGL